MTPCRMTLQLFNIIGIYGLPSGFYSYPDSVYRTFRRFPHRLTIPASEKYLAVLLCSIACIICFKWQIYKLPNAGTIRGIASLEPWNSLAFPLPWDFLVIRVFISQKTVTRHSFALWLLQSKNAYMDLSLLTMQDFLPCYCVLPFVTPYFIR